MVFNIFIFISTHIDRYSFLFISAFLVLPAEISIYTFLVLLAVTAVAMSKHSFQILVSKYHSLLRGIRASWGEKTYSRAGAGKVHLRTSCNSRSKEVFKMMDTYQKDTEASFKGLLLAKSGTI